MVGEEETAHRKGDAKETLPKENIQILEFAISKKCRNFWFRRAIEV